MSRSSLISISLFGEMLSDACRWIFYKRIFLKEEPNLEPPAIKTQRFINQKNNQNESEHSRFQTWDLPICAARSLGKSQSPAVTDQ